MNLDQMAYRCPESEVIGTARLEGYRLSFAGGSGVATILPCPGSHVDGVLWDISEADEQNLDYYEGFPRLYGKENVTVKDGEGQQHTVMVYTMNAPYRDDLALPSSSYLYGILSGCRQNDLDTGPVHDAFDRTVNELQVQRETQRQQRASKAAKSKGDER